MKTLTPILVIGMIVAAFLGGLFYRQIKPINTPQQLTLEQILSIRELHLVKHTYHDLFFLHRNNDPSKPIRAMVQVPCTITAYLNLKEVQLVYEGDSIRKVVLPHAILDEPIYQVNRLTVRETRGFQLHAGKDLYPDVTAQLSSVIQNRMDTARSMALANHILLQAEAEAKEYVESLLHTFGHSSVTVTFNDEKTDKAVSDYLEAIHKTKFTPARSHNFTSLRESITMGYLPMEK